MKRWGFLLVLAALWLAGGLQQVLPQRLAVFGARPDFILIALAAICPIVSRPGAIWTGFAGGVIQGAVAGANLTHYAISRIVTALALSWLPELRLESTPWLLAATGFLSTLLAQILLMFLAAPPGIAAFLGATIGSAVYNGVLMIPLFWVLGKLAPSARR